MALALFRPHARGRRACIPRTVGNDQRGSHTSEPFGFGFKGTRRCNQAACARTCVCVCMRFWHRSVRLSRVGNRALRVSVSPLKLHRLALCPLANRRGRAVRYSEDVTVLPLCSAGKGPSDPPISASATRCYVSWWHLWGKCRRGTTERRPTGNKQKPQRTTVTVIKRLLTWRACLKRGSKGRGEKNKRACTRSGR